MHRCLLRLSDWSHQRRSLWMASGSDVSTLDSGIRYVLDPYFGCPDILHAVLQPGQPTHRLAASDVFSAIPEHPFSGTTDVMRFLPLIDGT